MTIEVTHFLQGGHSEMVFLKIMNLLCFSVLKFPLTVLKPNMYRVCSSRTAQTSRPKLSVLLSL